MSYPSSGLSTKHGDRQVFHGDMIIVIRVFILILPLLNEIIVFSR